MASCLKTVNLEDGLPTSQTAIRRVTFEVNNAKASGVKVLKFIHGYGSSGVGGRIRTEVRRYLSGQLRSGKIALLIEGERFSIFDEDTRKAFGACDELRRDRDLDRHNNGVSFVVIK